MTATSKKLLFISRHSPYGSSLAKEALDAVLATSAYDQQLSLLFMDDGIFQLLKEQDAADIGQKSFAAMLPALSFYDINTVYAHKESLDLRQISREELIFNHIQILNSHEVNELMATQDQLLSF